MPSKGTASAKELLAQALHLAVAAAMLAACSPAAGSEADEIAAYEYSTSAADEILFLFSTGGMGRLAPQYRLYGDGRLVREIVNQYDRQPFKTSQVELAPADVAALLDLVVATHLPDLDLLDMRSALEALGDAARYREDGETLVLKLRFDSYERPDGTIEAPFKQRVSMVSPALKAELLPDLPEPAGLLSLREALDSYFAVSAAEAIFGKRDE